ncbi:hypothetical protein RugamoR1_29630 [Rugamonas sp. R1(2021)]
MFIDGIRHAVEIIEFAYERLNTVLTELALNPPDSEKLRSVSTAAFLDAWAMVDSIDRFRMLYQQMPGISFGAPAPGVLTLKEACEPFRLLRNVADHIAQRAEFIVSKGDGAALGVLTWVTCFQIEPFNAHLCMLRPGTLRAVPELGNGPLAATFDWPTSRICLTAGGYEANLSEIRPHIERRVKHLEGQLEQEFTRLGIADAPVANDVFIRKQGTVTFPSR